MADISKVTLPNGSTYDIKDATARTQISSEAATRKAADDSINNNINNLKSQLTGAMHYVGVTTTPITDGMSVSYTMLEGLEDTTAIIINGNKYFPKSGDVVIYQNEEFVATVSYSGKTKEVLWNEFGSTGSLKALAFKDSASGSVTPSGTVSTPTFTGTAGRVSVTASGMDFATNFIVDLSSSVGAYNSVSNQWAVGNVSTIGAKTTIRPTTVVSGGGVNITKRNANASFVSNAGSLPTFSANVTGETLSFNFTPGTLPSTTTVSVLTDVTATHTNPTVLVSPFNIGARFNGADDDISIFGTFTPQGTISQPTFTGNASNVTVK